MKGFEKFNPYEQIFNGADSFNTDPSAETISKRIMDKIHWVREWATLMNIMEYKGWTDPLTGDVHIVLRAGKMLTASHIGDAAEKLEEK